MRRPVHQLQSDDQARHTARQHSTGVHTDCDRETCERWLAHWESYPEDWEAWQRWATR